MEKIQSQRKEETFIIERNKNGILIYETINCKLFQKQYQGYTEKQAIKKFKQERKVIKKYDLLNK